MTGRPSWKDRARERRARRVALAISPAIVAERLGVSERRFAKLERGVNCPGERLARAWDDALFRPAE